MLAPCPSRRTTADEALRCHPSACFRGASGRCSARSSAWLVPACNIESDGDVCPHAWQKTHRLVHKAAQDSAGSVDGALPSASAGPSKLVLKEGQFVPNPDFNYTGPLRPVYPLSAKREVPAHIPRPDYADHRSFAWPS